MGEEDQRYYKRVKCESEKANNRGVYQAMNQTPLKPVYPFFGFGDRHLLWLKKVIGNQVPQKNLNKHCLSSLDYFIEPLSCFKKGFNRTIGVYVVSRELALFNYL